LRKYSESTAKFILLVEQTISSAVMVARCSLRCESGILMVTANRSWCDPFKWRSDRAVRGAEGGVVQIARTEH
jgi:hypothetical protein